MRCAKRLRNPTASGFVLWQAAQAVHFLWIDRFDGFHLSEVDCDLESSDPNAAMIFDCWTPASHRGHGLSKGDSLGSSIPAAAAETSVDLQRGRE